MELPLRETLEKGIPKEGLTRDYWRWVETTSMRLTSLDSRGQCARLVSHQLHVVQVDCS